MSDILVAGCYERFLFGFDLPNASTSQATISSSTTTRGKMERRFTYAAHKSTVKCVAGSGQWLVSGGADDTIHLYDLAHGKDLGFLMNPGDGAVPCLEFFSPSPGSAATHLFSGSADGSISIWMAGGGWEHLKTMRGHKLEVNDLAIHKSGRLALSVSRDSHLRMWNLAKGRCSYTAKLEVEGDLVHFSPSGEAYALTCGSKVTVHESSGEGSILGTLSHTRRVLCSAFGASTSEGNAVLLTGVEDGSVKVWDLRSATCALSMERMHESRVRGLVVVKPGSGGMPEVFATASSDGIVRLWDSRRVGGGEGIGRASCLLEGSTGGARITCLTLAQDKALPSRVKSVKEKAVVSEKRSGTEGEDAQDDQAEAKKDEPAAKDKKSKRRKA